MISRRQTLLPALAVVAAVVPQLSWWLNHWPLLGALLGIACVSLVKPERETVLLVAASALGAVALAASPLHMALVTLLALIGIGILSWPLGKNGVGGLAWIGLAVLVVLLAFGANRSEELATPVQTTSTTEPSAGFVVPSPAPLDTSPPSGSDAQPLSDNDRPSADQELLNEIQSSRDRIALLQLAETGSSDDGIGGGRFDGSVGVATPSLPEEDPNPSWFATLVLVLLALASHRLLSRSKSLAISHTRHEGSGSKTAVLARRFEWAGSAVGIDREPNETLLAYGARLTVATEDDRFRQCSNLLSAHLYGDLDEQTHNGRVAELDELLENLRSAAPRP